MTTPKLIFLRVYNMIIGRFSFGKRILRLGLEKILIKPGRSGTYTPCTKYFNSNNFKDE